MAPKLTATQLIDSSVLQTPDHVLSDESITLILSTQAYEELCNLQKKDFITEYGTRIRALKILVFDYGPYKKDGAAFPYIAITSKDRFEEIIKVATKPPYKIIRGYDPYGDEWRATMLKLEKKVILDLFQGVAGDKMDMSKRIIQLEDDVKNKNEMLLQLQAKTMAIIRSQNEMIRRAHVEFRTMGHESPITREMDDYISMLDSVGPPPDVYKKQRPTSPGVKDKFGKEILDRSIVKSDQGTIFVVDYNDQHGWVLLQSNKGSHPESQGDSFTLANFISENLELIGSIDTNPELLKD